MSDNSKPTHNGSVSFEQWLGKAERLDGAATPGPWHATEPEDWHGDTGYEPQSAVVASGSPLTWDDHSGEVFKPADAEWIAHARTALPAAAAALQAVLDLHVKVVTDRHVAGPTAVCEPCSEDRMFAEWPCPTVATITEALGEE